jgi:hypothetical protein
MVMSDHSFAVGSERNLDVPQGISRFVVDSLTNIACMVTKTKKKETQVV